MPRLTAVVAFVVVALVVVIVVVVIVVVVVVFIYLLSLCFLRHQAKFGAPARGGLARQASPAVRSATPPACSLPPPPAILWPHSGPDGQHNNCNHWESACFTYQHENLSNIKSKNVATLIK